MKKIDPYIVLVILGIEIFVSIAAIITLNPKLTMWSIVIGIVLGFIVYRKLV